MPANKIRAAVIRKWNNMKTPRLCQKKDAPKKEEPSARNTVLALTIRLNELCQSLCDSGKRGFHQPKGGNTGSGGSRGGRYAAWRKIKGPDSVEKEGRTW